jgi:uncharacterized RDD family membrane protein YckC
MTTFAPAGIDVHVTGRRVVATIIDGIIFGIVNTILMALFGTGSNSSGFSMTRLSAGGSVLLLILVLAYYILMEGLLGRTVGKMATGIKVIREDTGGVPGIGAAVIRTLLRIIDGLFAYLVGFVIVLSSQQRKRLGDMAARTLVVRA